MYHVSSSYLPLPNPSLYVAPQVPESCLPIGAQAEDGNTQLVPMELGTVYLVEITHTYNMFLLGVIEGNN